MSIQNNEAKAKQLWIGKVEVRPFKGSTTLGNAKGAFVNIVTWAKDASEFSQNADLVLKDLGLFVIAVENPELVSARQERAMLDEGIEEMVARAQGNPSAIIYGIFHTWDRDTA